MLMGTHSSTNLIGIRCDHRPPRFVTSFRPQAPMKYPAARFRTEAEIRGFKQPLLILFVPAAIRDRRGIDSPEAQKTYILHDFLPHLIC